MATKRRTASRASSPRRYRTAKKRVYHKNIHKVGIGTGIALLYAADQAFDGPVNGGQGLLSEMMQAKSFNILNPGSGWQLNGIPAGPKVILSSISQNWKGAAVGVGAAFLSTYIGHTSIGRKLSYKTKKWNIGVF